MDSPDRWMTHGDRIGKKAKDSVLTEAVAFATLTAAHCCWVSESQKVGRPSPLKSSPSRGCADLAERLKLVFRDRVEPQIPVIEIFAIPTDGDCGVVVIRTGRSQMAPHRVTTTLVCPIRRSDRCEKMTMREIQDLTLNLSRGLERLERRFGERSSRFEKEFDRLTTPDDAWGIRATAAR